MKKNDNGFNSDPVPARLDDATDVVEDGHGPLPTGQYVQRVRRFLIRGAPTNQINIRKTTLAYLERVDDGVEDGGEAAAADTHLRLGLQVLEPYLDGGHVDADPVDAVLELEQESLVVLVGDADEALQQRPLLLRAEAVQLDHAGTPVAAVERDDGVPHPVVGSFSSAAHRSASSSSSSLEDRENTSSPRRHMEPLSRRMLAIFWISVVASISCYSCCCSPPACPPPRASYRLPRTSSVARDVTVFPRE
ncbi:LOW QUALITY PROTEIN: hypothetical protein U9M48_018487, partial [Paspalum notatum var. saurae]